ncbi:hypothetical protein ON010_g4299 [Phytophthora cinnamomi]|nr:hypothetical protein ON010_g4299 [Phytophthora cinnamomi]
MHYMYIARDIIPAGNADTLTACPIAQRSGDSTSASIPSEHKPGAIEEEEDAARDGRQAADGRHAGGGDAVPERVRGARRRGRGADPRGGRSAAREPTARNGDRGVPRSELRGRSG